MIDYIGVIFVVLFLIIMSIQDLRNMEISLRLVVLSVSCGLCYRIFEYFIRESRESLYNPNMFADVIIAVFIAAVLSAVAIKSKMIGIGDALVIGMVGIYIGWIKQVLVLSYALLLVCILSSILLVLKKIRFKTRLPFIPFVLVANVGVVLWG